MTDLSTQLARIAGQAFVDLGLDAGFGAVRRSDRPDLADFQCNGAMAAAKAAKRNPREIATAVSAALQASGIVESAEAAGPGFINIRVTSSALADRAGAVATDPLAGADPVVQPRHVVIDFGGWNVAKEMHVGHLRSTIIGDSLQRLFRFRGDRVTSDVHLGDWGLQMGLLIVALSHERPDLPYFDADRTDGFPAESPVTMDDLGRIYPEWSARIKPKKKDADDRDIPNPAYQPEIHEAARRATAELQSGRAGYRALWRHFCAATRVGLERECGALGVVFDLWKGESDAEPFIPEIVSDLKARGIAQLDEGAWIVRVARESDRKEMPPLMLVNRDGAVGYHATDLGTIVDRKRELAPDLALYVVDQRQALHFEQVFRAADLAGYASEASLEHIGFGTMNGPDGKPFKTRDGGVLKLNTLIEQAVEAARVRIDEAGLAEGLPDAERSDIARKVGVAAIKFADLSNVRTTNYVFDPDRFVSFEGKTGPYLLYAAVRMKSLIRRAAAEGVAPGPVSVVLPEERALALCLDAVADAVAQAYDKRMPHVLCDHAFALAQAFSSFYAAAPIMAEKDSAARSSRLSLVTTTLHQLETVLSLVGIEAPERM